MGLMQSGSNFTDRIVKYVAKRAERKTKPASPPMGHVIPLNVTFLSLFNPFAVIAFYRNSTNSFAGEELLFAGVLILENIL